MGVAAVGEAFFRAPLLVLARVASRPLTVPASQR